MADTEEYEDALKNIKSYIDSLYFKDRSRQMFFLHVGPTNSGKTYHALKSFKEGGTGCYLSPLRLLAHEVYEDLNERGLSCSLHTGEEQIVTPGASFVAATVEMCTTTEFDSIIIDECSMIADEQRGEMWLRALLINNARQVHLILNEESEYLIESLLKIMGVDFVTYRRPRLTNLKPSTQSYDLDNIPKHCVIICFSRKTVHLLKNDLEFAGKKVSVIYGALPPEVKKHEMNRFINGETDVCVSTDAIGMGLNLPCRQILFYEIVKYDGEIRRTITAFEAKQIAGRAGRFNQFKTGYYSALNRYDHDILEELVESEPESFPHTYMGLDYNILKRMVNPTLIEKLYSYDKMSLIPSAFRRLVRYQSNKKYLENYILQLEKFPLKIAYAFLLCPVKSSNEMYYKNCVLNALIYEKIDPPPPTFVLSIENTLQMEEAEKYLSQMDLYIYMKNSPILSEYIQFDNEILEKKEHYSSLIIDFLQQKRNKKLRKCAKCNAYLPLWNNFKLCRTCHQLGY